jgi:hypothetical protein
MLSPTARLAARLPAGRDAGGGGGTRRRRTGWPRWRCATWPGCSKPHRCRARQPTGCRCAGPTAAARWPTTPTASARCWASWTPGCWPKARTCGRSRCWAPRRASTAAWPAPLRRVGAERLARQRGRRLQPVGRPPPPDATAPRVRRVGDLPARRACRCALQVRAARPHGQLLPLKADPYAREAELRPATASVVAPLPPPVPASTARQRANALDAPISIYEVHPGSWRRKVEKATAG